MNTRMKTVSGPIGIVILMLLCMPVLVHGQYSPVQSRALKANEIADSAPGFYGKAGATYVLTQDITSDRSAIFLGKDVTLDLNGYSITFADGNYPSFSNLGFEEGVAGWDLSKAPGAKVVNTKEVHVFVGE